MGKVADKNTEEQQPEYTLEEVIVTANRLPTQVSKTAANIILISKEEIAKGHYQNLGEVLRWSFWQAASYL